MITCKVDENVELRLHSRIYADELCSVVRKNLDHLKDWMIWATDDYSVESALEFIEASRKEFAETELPNCFIFENDKLIGVVGCVRPNLIAKSVEIGYWLDKDHTGKGIVTKCCRVLFDHVFKDLDFNRIIIRCEVGNKKSRAIPEKLRFTEEGIARQVEKKHDGFADLVVYSMLKEEWENI